MINSSSQTNVSKPDQNWFCPPVLSSEKKAALLIRNEKKKRPFPLLRCALGCLLRCHLEEGSNVVKSKVVVYCKDAKYLKLPEE